MNDWVQSRKVMNIRVSRRIGSNPLNSQQAMSKFHSRIKQWD